MNRAEVTNDPNLIAENVGAPVQCVSGNSGEQDIEGDQPLWT
jgi:hypothetical protein